jgi:hypothetical protein
MNGMFRGRQRAAFVAPAIEANQAKPYGQVEATLPAVVRLFTTQVPICSEPLQLR